MKQPNSEPQPAQVFLFLTDTVFEQSQQNYLEHNEDFTELVRRAVSVRNSFEALRDRIDEQQQFRVEMARQILENNHSEAQAALDQATQNNTTLPVSMPMSKEMLSDLNQAWSHEGFASLDGYLIAALIFYHDSSDAAPK